MPVSDCSTFCYRLLQQPGWTSSIVPSSRLRPTMRVRRRSPSAGKLAKDMGYDRNKWFGNVEVATAKLVGRETTQYVANIYKYYVAYRMAAQIYERQGARKGASGAARRP